MGLLEGAANFLGLGGGAPTPTTVDLDPETKKLIKQGADTGNRSAAAFGDDANKGVQAGGSMLQTEDGVNQAAAASGQNPAMMQAIRNQYGKVANKQIGDIVRGNMANANIYKAQHLQKYASAAMAQQRVQTQNWEMLQKAQSDAELMRAQVLQSAFGAVGSAAGAYMAYKNPKPQNNDMSFAMPDSYKSGPSMITPGEF